MGVPIDRERVMALIEAQFGSVDGLMVEWEARHEADPDHTIRHRDRSTVYNWLEAGLPTQQEVIFGFCSLLNVDPIGIMQSDQEFIEKNFAKERDAFQMSDKRDTLLAPFRIMYLPGWSWPNKKLAERHFNRPWHVWEYTHEADAVKSVYAALSFSTKHRFPNHHPRVFHFAYQQKNAIDRLWRPYGVIIATGEKVRLISESGIWREEADTSFVRQPVAETFFGPRATKFRIASLHDFSVTVEAPTKQKQVVRFD